MNIFIDGLSENVHYLQVISYYDGRSFVRERQDCEFQEFYPRLSKPIDEIDKVLATHYGFTHEELDFIINYDIKYRMGLNKNGLEEDES